MFHIIGYYREILYYQRIPKISGMLILFSISIIILIIGYKIFNKLQKKFAEEL